MRIDGHLLRLTLLAAASVGVRPSLISAQTTQSVDLELRDAAGLEQRLRRLLSTSSDSSITVSGGEAHRGDFQLAAGRSLPGDLLVISGNADIGGSVAGNVVVLDGNLTLRSGAIIRGGVLTVGGRIVEPDGEGSGTVVGERRAIAATFTPAVASSGGSGFTVKLAGVLGVVLMLGLVGFGLVLFAKPQLEIVSGTVSHSLVRSFLAGLLAEVVAIPTAGLLVVGLVMSVVGILLVPFVAVVVPLIALAAVLIGFLAVAHAMGETHLRRRMAAGVLVGSPSSFRNLMIGLGAVAVLWLGWVGFGWVPFAGALVFLLALVTTWTLATIGIGAFLLSRGGLRPGFDGRLVPPEAMTDEYLWATPRFGVTAAQRPPSSTRDPPGRNP